MKALLIIDIQNDFLPGGALAVPEGYRIIPVVNKLQDHFELVVATQDWHPSTHRSFASNHENKKPFDILTLSHGPSQTLWPDHCIQGTHGADFPASLNKNSIEAILRKGTKPETDSYSGFYDNGRQPTGLAGYLKNKNIHQIFVAGLCADICVHYTAMDSLKEGFKTYIIEEGTCPLNKENYLKTKEEFLSGGGKMISAAGII